MSQVKQFSNIKMSNYADSKNSSKKPLFQILAFGLNGNTY